MTIPAAATRRRGGAVAVAAGILLSRLFGLARQRVVSHFLGVGDAADVLSAALRIPNVLQNLLGEGVLSASFVPVYARLRAEGREDDAGRLARTVFAALALVCAALVLVGIAVAPALVASIAGGFDPAKRELTVELVRILFPGVALLVLSAWCLGVLNAHRLFFVSYASPVLWNTAIIVALVWRGNTTDAAGAARIVAMGAVAGSLLQFVAQLPWIARVLPAASTRARERTPEFRRVVANFSPVLLGRGVVQLSAWLDTLIASFVMPGAAAVLFYAQNIALLPVSVFGMSMSVSELTEMSGHSAADIEHAIRARMEASLRAMAYFVVPSSAAMVILGDVIAAAVLQTGRFTRSDAEWVWAVLAGSSLGLLAGTMGRLYNSAWYALHDTKTPVRMALIRIAITGTTGWVAALYLPEWLHVEPRWGVAGLTASAGMAAWIEYAMLRARLNARIGFTGLPRGFIPRLWGAALAACAVGYAVKVALPPINPLPGGAAILGVVGVTYFAITQMLGVPEATEALARVRARFGGNGRSR